MHKGSSNVMQLTLRLTLHETELHQQKLAAVSTNMCVSGSNLRSSLHNQFKGLKNYMIY